jgi:hypothetical protein
MKYWIYRNLHTNTWSVKQGGIVISHPVFLHLEDVEFRVWQGVLKRIRREGRKRVGAFVVAHAISSGNENDYRNDTFNFISHKWTEVTFNPYKYDSFVVKATEEPIFFARECIMTPDMKVWVK